MAVLVSARLWVVVDDLLAPQKSLAPARTASKVRNPALRRAIDAQVRSRAVKEDCVPYVLAAYTKQVRRGPFGLLPGTERVPARLVSWRPSWVGGGLGGAAAAMAWDFVWEVPECDLDAVRASIAGGITGGWGEGAEQAMRFGPLCAYDDDADRYEPATRAQARAQQLRAYDSGRYALLLTLVGAAFEVMQQPVAPSPAESATAFPPGTKRKGGDGRMYVVTVARNGVRRWMPLKAAPR